MAKLVATRGLPGSGKSWWARGLNASWKRVNRDDLRDMVFGTRLLSGEQENAISVAEKAAVEGFLKAGYNVVVDAMHLKSRYVRDWAKLAAKHGADFEIKSFLDVPLEVCIQRDAMREGEARLGEDVIRGIYKRFFPIPKLKLDDIEPLKGTPYVPNENLPTAYMVDIDGTSTTGPCDRSPYEWLKVDQDRPNEPVLQTVRDLWWQGHHIIFCSGRDEVCRDLTRKWLWLHFGVLDRTTLLMRKEGDMRKDSVVKMELFDNYIRDYYNVIGVFDDRPQVLRMWRSLGLTVFDVAGSEEF